MRGFGREELKKLKITNLEAGKKEKKHNKFENNNVVQFADHGLQRQFTRSSKNSTYADYPPVADTFLLLAVVRDHDNIFYEILSARPGTGYRATAQRWHRLCDGVNIGRRFPISVIFFCLFLYGRKET